MGNKVETYSIVEAYYILDPHRVYASPDSYYYGGALGHSNLKVVPARSRSCDEMAGVIPIAAGHVKLLPMEWLKYIAEGVIGWATVEYYPRMSLRASKAVRAGPSIVNM